MNSFKIGHCCIFFALWLISIHAHVHDLKNTKHTKDGEHNPDFDHEAFLGRDEAKEYDSLSPEESRLRLGSLYDKVESNGDGYVTAEELTNWIKKMSKRYIMKDRDRSWMEHNVPENQHLSWKTYIKAFVDEESEVDDDKDHLKTIVAREELRWKAADLDGDGELTKDEYLAFIHPEDFDHMRHIIVDEAMADMDSNKDGFIDINEYMADMGVDVNSPQGENSWIEEEKKRFTEERDKNHDGQLDREELMAWISPPSNEYAAQEATHLVTEADDNKDGKLSKEEVLNHHDLFVGSQATDFGELLPISHEEL